mgnify:FL=1
MIYLALLIIPVLYFCFLLKVKIYNPLFITFVLWGGLLFIYATVNHNLYELTDKFYLLLFLYLICFLGGFIAPYLLEIKKLRGFRNDNTYIEGFNYFNFIYKIALIITVYLSLRYILLLLSGTNIYVLTADNKKPIDVQIMNYFNVIPLCLFFYILLYKNIRKYKFFLFLFIISVLLTFGKMLVMQVFIGAAIILYSKRIIKLRHIIFASVTLILGLIFLQSLRYEDSDSSNKLQYIIKILVIYILSPLKAVDKVFNNEIYLGHGHLFGFIYRVLEKLFHIRLLPKENIYTWVFVPVPTNVYTIMKNSYVDYGSKGMMFYSFFIGFFWSVIYQRQIKSGALKVFFFCNIYILVVQFFDDILTGQFSFVLQTFLISYFIYAYFKRKRKLPNSQYLQNNSL